MEADLAESGAIPYIALKQLRTRVGEKLNNLTLVTDVSKGELKRLYGALSSDLTEAARQSSPAALKAAQRANRFYSAGRKRIDTVERVIDKNGGPEKVFAAAMSGTKEGATTLRTVMKSIPFEDRNVVTAAVIRRLGKATPGRQDATTEAFSISTYLTNWARLSPEARSVLFGRLGREFNKNMKALADVAGNIREGSAVFRNPSGTSQALVAQGTAGATVFSIATGRLSTAATILAGVGAADVFARVLTKPTFVKWLAQTTTVPPGAYAAQLQVLIRAAQQSGDEDLATIAALLEISGEQEVN